MEAAFALSNKKRYAERVFENAEGVFVIRWDEQKEIDKKKYQEEKKRYRFSLMQSKLQTLFGDWLKNLKKKAQIEILQPEVLQY